MSMWDKPLTRENFDEFFRLFATPAYRSTYRILGDTTRTENALTDAFLEVYHRRNSDDSGNLVFLFSDILQKRVENLASRYPVSETTRVTNRVLDEFTENSILAEIHRRIDTKSYRILEIFTATASGKANAHSDSILAQVRNSGISLFLILQLILVAILIFAITFTSANTVFGIDDIIPQSPQNAELSIEDLLGPVLNYLPLSVYGQAAQTDTALTGTETLPADSSAEGTTIPQASDTTLATTSMEPTVASATRG